MPNITKEDISQIVSLELSRYLPAVNQSIFLDKITKWQTAKILGYGTTKALIKLATNGKRMSDGEYYTIKPDENGHYDYNEVVAFRKMIEDKTIR